MRKSLFAIGAVLFSALVASADDFGKYEAFLGYSFVRFNPNTGCSASGCGSLSSKFQFQWRRRSVRVQHREGDWGGLRPGAVTKGTLNQTSLDTTVLNFVLGPRYTFRFHESRFQPFVQALFGGAYSTASTQVSILGGEIVTPHLPPTVGSNLPFTTRLVASENWIRHALGRWAGYQDKQAYDIPPNWCRLLPYSSAKLPDKTYRTITQCEQFPLHSRRELRVWEGLNIWPSGAGRCVNIRPAPMSPLMAKALTQSRSRFQAVCRPWLSYVNHSRSQPNITCPL